MPTVNQPGPLRRSLRVPARIGGLFALIGLAFLLLRTPDPALAACWCAHPVGDSCRCTSSGTSPYNTAYQGIQIFCDSQAELDSVFTLKAPICGSSPEILPFCAYRKDPVTGGADFSQATCYGTEFALGESNIPPDTGGTVINWSGPVSFNGFQSTSVTSLFTCNSIAFCCNRSDISCDESGIPPLPSACSSQDLGIIPPSGVCGDVGSRDASAPRTCAAQLLRNDEPHPLRPNPGQACTDAIPQGARLTCGTDLVAVKSTKLPRGGTGCAPISPAPGETVTCSRDVRVSNIPISIGLKDLELPIAGVASNTTISDTLTGPQKMTNYASWFGQGAIEQSTQEPLDYADPATADILLQLEGPIKKLIPRELIDKKKEALIQAAAAGTTYNQIIGYVKNNKVIGRLAANGDPAAQAIRISDMATHLNPPYVPNDEEAAKWYALWQQTPFVQTADMAGEIFATVSSADPNVKDAALVMNSSLADLRVSFPHLLEVNQLSQILQSIFKPVGVPETTGFTEPNSVDYSSVNRETPWNTNYCNLQTTYWNPGDNLESTKTLSGTFSFTKHVTYTYRELTVEEKQYYTDNGLPFPSTVDVDVSGPVAVYARNPLEMDDIYDRLVNGPSSIFKALFPINEKTIGEHLNDYPAAAGVSLGCGPDCTVWPGNQKGRKGEVFFPHWESILIYFHQNLQKGFDPLGRAVAQFTPTTPGGVPACQEPGNLKVTEKSASRDAALAAASAQECVDRGILDAILLIEAGAHYDPQTNFCAINSCSAAGPMQHLTGWNSVNCDANQCGGDTCRSWCDKYAAADQTGKQTIEQLFEGPPAGVNVCNLDDALIFGAQKLKAKGGISQSGCLTTANTEALARATMGYYGNNYSNSKSPHENCTNPADRVTRNDLPGWSTPKTYCEYVFERNGLTP